MTTVDVNIIIFAVVFGVCIICSIEGTCIASFCLARAAPASSRKMARLGMSERIEEETFQYAKRSLGVGQTVALTNKSHFRKSFQCLQM